MGAAANMARVALMNTVGESITARLRRDMYQALLRQDMSFFDAVRTGELVSRLASDTVRPCATRVRACRPHGAGCCYCAAARR